MRRRSIAVAVAVALVAGAAAWASVGFGGGAPDPAASVPERAETAQIKRETLVNWVTMDGELGFGAAEPLAATAAGTVTWLAAPGTRVARGQTLLRVDDKPVVLLYGQLPMYRDLQAGLKGADVAQFEANLKALGYSGFAADPEFSASTTVAVKRWQAELGLPETGVVAAGQIVYARSAVRVAQQLVRLGAASPADVLSVTGTTKMVSITAPTAGAGWAVRAAKVTIALPDGTTVDGQVDSVGEATTAEGQAGPQVRILISLAAQKAADRGTVTVRHAVQERADVLTVPIAALLALAEGGYGLEVVDGGKSTVVAVQVGLFAGGRVEVSGSGIAEGLTVRVPA
ncbi:MAG: peptidoglycan-binding protein [Hamadaea sp.]|uniref:peptidoglycan-binding domain-containing protein n=1 Tax=Hamadaea sp. TaxID=2024425 RepID=UPI00183BEF94|nr:peptidoglycan-binding domain-containing protein [Hamadaea sp.]NUR73344.1 peptidoglycan-binding protein [Hamadaea sp.]NUT21288.1 peptidoglycan-binding protein [Hamadaea sp.]